MSMPNVSADLCIKLYHDLLRTTYLSTFNDLEKLITLIFLCLFTFPYGFIFIEIIQATGQMIAFKISKMGACVTIRAVLAQWWSAWLLTTWSLV